MSRPAQTSKSKGPPTVRKAVPAVEQLQASHKSFQNFSRILSYLEQGALGSSVAEGTLKRRDLPFEGGASSTDSADIGWLEGRFDNQSHDVTLWQGLRQLLQCSYVAL